MKYRIKKIIRETLEIPNNESGHTEISTYISYYIEQKRTIFGFWKPIGLEFIDTSEKPYIKILYFDIKENCQNFIKQYHYHRYGTDVNFKIIDKTNEFNNENI